MYYNCPFHTPSFKHSNHLGTHSIYSIDRIQFLTSSSVVVSILQILFVYASVVELHALLWLTYLDFSKMERPDVYIDALWIFLPYKYMGLSTYTLPKNKTLQPRNIIDIILPVIVVCCVILSIGLRQILCDNSLVFWLYDFMFAMFDVQVLCVMLNAHIKSKHLMKAFERLSLIDKKLETLNNDRSLKMAKQSILIVTCFRYSLLVAGLIADITFFIAEHINARFFICAFSRYISALWRIQSGCLHVFFIREYTRRMKHIRSLLEQTLFTWETIGFVRDLRNINKSNNVEDARVIVSRIMEAVSETNRVFEEQILFKVGQVFFVVLVLGYLAADTYFFNQSLSTFQSTFYVMFLITHTVLHCLDMFVDIWYYRCFEQEVKSYPRLENDTLTVFCRFHISQNSLKEFI